MIFGAQYSYEDELRNTDRAYTNPNQTARATASGITDGLPLAQTNFNNFNCAPAGIRPNAAWDDDLRQQRGADHRQQRDQGA